jgi:hypothetical protein
MAATLNDKENASSPHAAEADSVRRDANGRVTHLCGPGNGGGRWSLPIEAVIAAVQRDEARFFVTRGGQQLGLCVKDGELAAMVDDGWTVRSLPRCDEASEACVRLCGRAGGRSFRAR